MTDREVDRRPDPGDVDTGDYPVQSKNRRRSGDPVIDQLQKRAAHTERMLSIFTKLAALIVAISVIKGGLEYYGVLNQGPGQRIDATNRRLDTLIVAIARSDSIDRAERKRERSERQRITYELCLISPTGKTATGKEDCARILLKESVP